MLARAVGATDRLVADGASTELADGLRAQDRAWRERPLVRALYTEWFAEVGARLSRQPGRSVELGAGIGRFHAVHPEVEPTDVTVTPWAETVVDAEQLPYEDATVANLVLIDVFHHVARPARFIDEAARVLVPGGRAVILDPYCSTVSTLAYRRWHHERTDLEAVAFDDDPRVASDPLASNQARATLAFFRGASEFERRWPMLVLAERRRLALLAYPLSGGFGRRPLVTLRVGLALQALERFLSPLAPILAFRCLVVLERVVS
jgi:SAM-dependent methyltransferase